MKPQTEEIDHIDSLFLCYSVGKGTDSDNKLVKEYHKNMCKDGLITRFFYEIGLYFST